MMETLLLCAAAFVGGGLNTIAGGGSFLTLPALMHAFGRHREAQSGSGPGAQGSGGA
jgi:uncharacterized membrane protein YfcA